MARRSRPSDDWQFLRNVGTHYELELITSILAQDGILVMKKSQGSGAYTDVIMGTSLTGYDIYVPARRLAEAQDILENLPVFEENEINYQERVQDAEWALPNIAAEPIEEGFLLRNRGYLKILFFFFVVLPLIFGLLVALFKNLRP
ncbi:MAG TPA: DUF2007 domain-containing protein [Syntrophomonas sp.]|nr:DUF2007 domain-containing protein [Syntrophomonas sp.]HRW13464.1 DUF2007 domain-containing protein [Syntrophomonas sp.]